MKRRTKRVLILATAFCAFLAFIPAYRFHATSRDYGEAEPLVEVVWLLAREMKRFAKERGRPPADLDELARFAPNHDFSRLHRYPREFSSSGLRRFSLRVNSRFGFTIDEHYTPEWVFPKNPWWAAPNSQE